MVAKIKAMIEARERQVPPATNYPRIYAYVRPLKNGEAAIDVWGAMNHRRRKGNPLVCKKFYTFRTDRDSFLVRDIVLYNSWSSMCPDHICYSFPEAGRDTYCKYLGSDAGAWLRNKISTQNRGHLPRYATFLNGWENTKYKYSGYNSQSGFFFNEYFALWREFPMAEIISKMGCFNLLTKTFLKRLRDNKDFARYVAKGNGAIRRHALGPAAIYSAYKRKADLEQYVRDLENAERIERERRRAEAERAAIEYERQQAKRLRVHNKRIAALYKQIYTACRVYGAYEVVCPQSAEEMLAEGKAMHNCIGQCYTAHQGKYDICLFLRKDGKPYVDFRISMRDFTVQECRLVCNKNAGEDEWRIANETARLIAAINPKKAADRKTA